MIQVHSDAMTVHFKSYHSKFRMFSLEENKSCAQKPRFNCTNSTRISGFLFLFVIISCSTCIRSYCIKFWKRSDPRLSETTLRLPSEGIPFIEEQLFDPRLSKATHSCVISFCKLLKKRITLTAVRGSKVDRFATTKVSGIIFWSPWIHFSNYLKYFYFLSLCNFSNVNMKEIIMYNC